MKISSWKTRVAVVGCLAAGLGGLTACGSPGGAAGDDTLVIGLQDPGSALPILIAQDQGLFEENGAPDVELQYMNQVTAMTAALGSGELDAALQGISVVAAYNDSTSDSQFEYFAPTALNETTLLAREGSGIPAMTETSWKETVEAFEGRTIGVTAQGGFGDLMIRYMAKEVGLDPDKDMTLVAVGIGDTAAAAIRSEQVDVVPEIMRGTAMQTEEGLSYVIGDLVAGDAPEPFKRMFGGGLFAPADTLDEDPDQWTAVAAALADAREFLADEANVEAVKAVIREEIAGDDVVVDYIYDRREVWADVSLDEVTSSTKNLLDVGMVPVGTDPVGLVWDKARD